MYEVVQSPTPPELDWDLVRTLRTTVVDRLSMAAIPEAHRRELGRNLARQAVTEWMRAQVVSGLRPSSEYGMRLQKAVFDAVFGLGRLEPLMRSDVEGIEIHGCDTVWLRLTNGHRERGPAIAETDEELVSELQFLASRQGRALSTAAPRLHMELPDGSRLAAVIATTRRPNVVIRRHLLQPADLDELAGRHMLTPTAAEFLRAAVLARRNIVVVGGQGSGKTTLVRSLAGLIPAAERWATAEQEYELHLDRLLVEHRAKHPHLVAFQARQGGSEIGADGRSAGEVTLEEIVRDALRMNLSRIMVGEVRGPEVVPMLDAMSTGDGGSMCTLHARSARDAIERLVVLCGRSQTTLTPDISYRWIAGAVDLIVHVQMREERTDDGQVRVTRYVDQITEVTGIGEQGRPALNDLFLAQGEETAAHPTGIMPKRAEELHRMGWKPAQLAPSATAGGVW